MMQPLEALTRQRELERELCDRFEEYLSDRARSELPAGPAGASSEESIATDRALWQTFARYFAERSRRLQEIGATELEDFLVSCNSEESSSSGDARQMLSLIDQVMRVDATRQGAAPNTAAEALLCGERYCGARAQEPSNTSSAPRFSSPVCYASEFPEYFGE